MFFCGCNIKRFQLACPRLIPDVRGMVVDSGSQWLALISLHSLNESLAYPVHNYWRTHLAKRDKRREGAKAISSAVPATAIRQTGAGVKPRWFWSALLLVFITLVVYSPVRHHSFINYDDEDYVVRNTHIHPGVTVDSVEWAFTTTAQANWHPLTWISHALDCELFGLDPAGHHLMNLAFHILNIVLLYWALTLLTGSAVRSLMVAALFGLHPLNVESVAWVAERKNVLSTSFFLLSLAAYALYVRKPSMLKYLVIASLFVLALMSKPMVVTFPFVLLLIDYWPLQRVEGCPRTSDPEGIAQISFKRCLREKIPLIVLAAASCVVTLIAQRRGGAVKSMETFPFLLRLANAGSAYILYLWKALFPARLAIFYPYSTNRTPVWLAICALVGILTATLLAWKFRRTAPYLTVGWLWFVGTLVPVIGLVQVGGQSMADRYTYIPLIGISIATVWSIADLLEMRRIKPVWALSLAVGVLALLSWATWMQLCHWKDSYALWTHDLAVTPDNPTAETQLGMAALTLDRQPEAMQHFQIAIALGTHDPTSYLNLGAYLNEHGKQNEAIPILKAALAMNEDTENRILTHLNLGFAYTSTADYQKASLQFRNALQIDREKVLETIVGLAQFATSHSSARDYMKLGLLLEESGDKWNASSAYQHVLQIDPGNDAARYRLLALRAPSRRQ